MDTSKLLVIAGVVFGIVFFLWMLSLILRGNDPVEEALATSLQAQVNAVEISDITSSRSSDLETQSLATNILSTTSSDYQVLSEYYRNNYASAPSRADSAIVDDINNAGENLGSIYRQTVREQLQISLDNLENIPTEDLSDNFIDDINSSILNHQRHLSRLE
ncbi:MAG: hypothetical protein WD061_03345 [Candidatus Saccharimonadales bacterium]